MFFLTLLIIGATLFLLSRRGIIGPPPWVKHGGLHSPEGEAKRILAQRFASSEISSEEFMERASVLNWTPGSQPVPARVRKTRR